MGWKRVWNQFLGFCGVAIVFLLLAYLVEIEQIVAEVSQANLLIIFLVVLATLSWLLMWTLALQTVLQILDVQLSLWKSFLVFAGASCLNNLTPLGQVGGSPATALLISRTAETEYETGLASIASIETLNFFPSIALALLSTAYIVTNRTPSAKLRYVIGVTFFLSLLIPAMLYLGWRYRDQLRCQTILCVSSVSRVVARVLPVVSLPTKVSIKRRIDNFFMSIDRVTTNKRGLGLIFIYLTLGWGCQMFGLWLAFRAIGFTIPFIVTVFIVPIAAIAGIAPLPGGAGGIEAVLLGLLLGMNTAMTLGLTEGTIAATIVIFRGAVYWIPVILGSVSIGILRVDGSI